MVAEREQYAAELSLMTQEVAEWNKALKAVDPYLEMVWAPESVQAPGLVPGRYHVLRHNPGAPPSPLPLTDEKGGFKEPGSWVFDMLEKADLWNDRAARDRKAAQEELKVQRRKRHAQERREIAEELDDRIKALNPSVSMTNQGKGWKWKAGA